MRRAEIALWVAAAILAIAVTVICFTVTPSTATSDGDGAAALSLDEYGVVTFEVDLNTADQMRLMRLPGMKTEIAQAILDYRAYYGGFSDVREIGNVPGVTGEMSERWLPYLTLGAGGTESSR